MKSVHSSGGLFIGGVVSCLALSVIAFGATLAGHGSYAPMVFVVSFIYFFGYIHPVLAFLLVPIYWGMVFVLVKGNKQRVFAWLLIHSVGFIAVNLVDKDYFSLQKIKAGVSSMVIFLTVFFLIVLYLLRSSHKKPS